MYGRFSSNEIETGVKCLHKSCLTDFLKTPDNYKLQLNNSAHKWMHYLEKTSHDQCKQNREEPVRKRKFKSALEGRGYYVYRFTPKLVSMCTHPAPIGLKSFLLCRVYIVKATVIAAVNANASITDCTSYNDTETREQKLIFSGVSSTRLKRTPHGDVQGDLPTVPTRMDSHNVCKDTSVRKSVTSIRQTTVIPKVWQ